MDRLTASPAADQRMRVSLDILALMVSLAACFGVAVLGGLGTAEGVRTWYPTLIKPSWNPPNWVFGPVWTTLYTMMAVAAWLIWRQRDRVSVGPALRTYGVQLLLNLAWSFIFFGSRAPGAAFAEIVVLWLAIVATIVTFWKIHRGAAVMLVPYLFWVTFATVLNGAIWRLNL